MNALPAMHKDYYYIENLIPEGYQNLIYQEVFDNWQHGIPFIWNGNTVNRTKEKTQNMMQEYLKQRNINIDWDMVVDHPQFVHMLFGEKELIEPLTGKPIFTRESSPFKYLFKGLIDCLYAKTDLNIKNFGAPFTRGKINLVTPQPNYSEKWYAIPHFDILPTQYKGEWSLIYYINDSDGDTRLFLENDEVVSFTPKKGSALLFKSNILHAGSPPTQTNARSVVNIILKIGE